MSRASELLHSLNEGYAMRLDPYSGEDRAKLIQAADKRSLKIIHERDKDGYFVVEVAENSAEAAAFKSYAKTDLKAKFSVVEK